MSKYSAGSMTGDQLIDEFGLQQGGDVGSGFNAGAGASDGNKTKGNKALGDGYLTDKTYNKLKNDSKVKAAYASINGQAAADKKFSKGGISINTMDSLFDDLTKEPEQEQAPEAPEPEFDRELEIPESNEIKQAKERVQNYESNILSGETSRRIYGNNQDFLDKYQFNPYQYTSNAPTPVYENNDFTASDISAYETEQPIERAADSFLREQKLKTIKDFNIKAVS